MTEQQIRECYERLDGTLEPPRNAAALVQRAVAARRARRRAVVGAAGALAVVAVGGAVFAVVSGDAETPTTAVDAPPGAEPALVLTRPDGTTFAFSDLTVTCKQPFEGARSGRGQRIWMYSPIVMAPDTASGEEKLKQPFVLFEGSAEDLAGAPTFTLPVDGPGGTETYPMSLFVADTEGAPDGNEVVSSGNSSGTVRVLRATCEPSPKLELEIDATLGSEEGKQSLEIAGSAG